MTRSAGRERISPAAVIKIPSTTEIHIAVRTAAASSRFLPAPKNCDIIIVEPAESPVKNPTRRFM